MASSQRVRQPKHGGQQHGRRRKPHRVYSASSVSSSSKTLHAVLFVPGTRPLAKRLPGDDRHGRYTNDRKHNQRPRHKQPLSNLHWAPAGKRSARAGDASRRSMAA